MDAKRLSLQLRESSQSYLGQRRAIVGLSLTAIGALRLAFLDSRDTSGSYGD